MPPNEAYKLRGGQVGRASRHQRLMAESRGTSATLWLGHWISETGQSVKIKRFPLLGPRVSYRPERGRTRSLRVAKLQPMKISLYLGWFGPLETMLHLSLVFDPYAKEIVMVPEIESGPESRWDRDDFGYPWLFPIKEFRGKHRGALAPPAYSFGIIRM
jgi:hypothetical protein